MVFKGRFFSSAFSNKSSNSSSSSDGSNSPRTSASSPHRTLIRRAIGKKHTEKDNSKGKEAASPAKLRVKAPPATANDGGAAPFSPAIMAASLGLDRMKTRSGPLPQEGPSGDQRVPGISSDNLSRGDAGPAYSSAAATALKLGIAKKSGKSVYEVPQSSSTRFWAVRSGSGGQHWSTVGGNASSFERQGTKADLSGPAVSGTALYGEEDVQVSAQLNEQEHKKKRSAVGTPDYLAPEILLGTGHGASADWWSLGVILFELIVGLPPFHAHHPQKIFDNILKRKISWPPVPSEMSFEAHDLIDKLLTEDPHQRLGANGATEVKKHMFFKDINWDTLARQKAAFVPSSDDAFDTSYFTSRYSWNPSDEQIYEASELEDSSDNGSVSGNNSCMSHHDALGDDTGGPDEFDHSTSINYSFSNFSFKNLSQLASINYDLISKGWKEDLLTKSDDS